MRRRGPSADDFKRSSSGRGHEWVSEPELERTTETEIKVSSWCRGWVLRWFRYRVIFSEKRDNIYSLEGRNGVHETAQSMRASVRFASFHQFTNSRERNGEEERNGFSEIISFQPQTNDKRPGWWWMPHHQWWWRIGNLTQLESAWLGSANAPFLLSLTMRRILFTCLVLVDFAFSQVRRWMVAAGLH